MELFGKVCSICNERSGPAPDHALGLVPYLGEMALRALEHSNLIERVDHGVHAMHAYTSTAKGKQLWERLEAESRTLAARWRKARSIPGRSHVIGAPATG